MPFPFALRISDLLRISSFELRISTVIPLSQLCLSSHALFDEMNRIPQSSPTMRRLLGICLAMVTVTLAALGQTNPPANSRQLSLQDCIEMALKHNLDLRIDRYNPEIQLFTLEAYYGYYDPTLNLSGQHSHEQAGSRILSGGFFVAGATSDQDSFNATLTGNLPWGTTYTLGTISPIQDTTGTSGTTVNTTNINSLVPF